MILRNQILQRDLRRYSVRQYLTLFGKFRGLLDDFPVASFAASLRALSGDWVNTPVVEVRRSSDSATDKFTESQILNGDLVDFVGAGNDGFVTTWYDQSGEFNDATQATTTSQPKIVDAGSLLVDLNGLPKLTLDGVDDSMNFSNAAFDIGGASTYVVCRHRVVINNDASFVPSVATSDKRWYSVFTSGGNFNFGYAGSTTAITAGSDDTSWHLFSMNAGSNVEGFKDGVSQGTATVDSGFSNNSSKIGAISGAFFWDGDMSELIVYNSDMASDVSGINANIISHYTL